MKKQMILTAIIIFVLLIFAILIYFFTKNNKDTGDYYNDTDLIKPNQVIEVIDGDTIKLYNKETVRLIGIDTPEKGKRCYTEAKDRLTELVLDKVVTLEKDKTDKDMYNRSLRYVYINFDELSSSDKEFINITELKDNNTNPVNINILLVKEGYASVFIYGNDTKYESELNNASEYAKENNLGCLHESWRLKGNCSDLRS